LSTQLSRRSDGRWTQRPRQADFVPPGIPVDPATTELAVTKARLTRTDAEWAAVNDYDPAFEEASSRFFETAPGNRLTFDHLTGNEAADDGVGETHIPGLDPPPAGRVEGGYVEGGYVEGGWVEGGYVNEDTLAQDPRQTGPHSDFGLHDSRRSDPPTDPGYPAGSGYEAVYGGPPIEPVEPDVDDHELATGAAARRNAIEWAVVLVAAVLLALVLRALVLQAFYIPSPSMEDTLLIQDRVLVNKLSYRFGDVGRGDIVVFHRTEDEIATAGPDQPKDVIKRVIALGGETIEIRESKVFINDQELLEPYLEPGLVMPDFGPVTVPEGFVFVMGDNRNLSSDSRGELGPIAEERVVGRAFVLFWPVSRVSRL